MADRAGTVNQDFYVDRAGQRSLGEIMQDVARDMSAMVRSEFRLAKAELRESAQQAGKGAGMLGGAAVCGFFAAACLVVACIWLLMLAMPLGAAAALMALLLACGGAALYYAGRSRLRQVNPVPERTIETLKEPLR
jgi:uncharacterized membrane protein YqjE